MVVEVEDSAQLPSSVIPTDGPVVGPPGNGASVSDLVPASAEEVTFLPSGKIRLILGSHTITLRRPTLGQFRHFRETLYEEQDAAHAELLAKANALVEEAQADTGTKTPEQQRDELVAIVEAARKTRIDAERQEATYVAWCRNVVQTLGKVSLAEIPDDDLPFLFGTGDFVTAIQRHWRTVPLPSGVR